jgi:hypothetical protein
MLPVLAKYRFAIARNLGGYIAAGPFAGLLLSAKNITSGSGKIFLDNHLSQPISPAEQSFDNNSNIKSDLHSFNAGISGNAGIYCKAGRGRLFLEGGGNYGFFNIQKINANGKNKTGAAVVTAGYEFPLRSH